MKTTTLYLVILCLFVCSINETFSQGPGKSKKIKNIILVIGDGTGLSQVSAAQFFKEAPSNYDRFPVVGLIKTSSTSDLITDSAASATSYASGIKTYNGAIGVTTDTIPVPTIVELVSEKNMQTGVVATSSITHATPACFYAHVPSRYNYEDIATFLPKSEVDFFAGAGLKYFYERTDGINLLESFWSNGFTIETDILKDDPEANKLGFLLAPKSMPTMLEGRGNFLQEASQLAIKRLTNEDGFFLMVEASQIDWGGHDNDSDYLIAELIDLDNTIGALLDFAETDRETLVIVTADHETGGFTLAAKDGDYNTIEPSFSTTSHSATMVPVFAFGPGAANFGGVYENTEVFHKIMKLLSH